MNSPKITTIPCRDWFRNQPLEWRNQIFEIICRTEAYKQEQEQAEARREILALKAASFAARLRTRSLAANR